MGMKPLALALILALPSPAFAQEEENGSLMREGAQKFFQGLMQEMDPAMQTLQEMMQEAGPAMRSFLQEMGPAMVDLFKDVKDFSAYHAPEVLPNGDIIMRKKQAEEMPSDPGPHVAPQGEVDL